MALTAQQIHQRWLQAMQSPTAAANYNAGIAAVTTSPTAAAATQEATQRYLMGVQDSVNSGRREQALNGVSLQQWQQAAQTKGGPRLSSGAQASQQKALAAYTKWAPIYAQASAAAKALPKGGEVNALARVQAAMRVMKQAAGKA